MPKTVYNVFSRVLNEDGETGTDQLETRRTDKNAAYEDRNLIQSILHRKAWVQEVES